jgi:hypothetical protein
MIVRILLGLSIVMNGVLIAAIIGWMPFFIYMLVTVVALLLWYITSLFTKIEDINDDVDELFETLGGFGKHLERLYSMEMFYGDETLHSLIDHSRNVLDDINFYRQRYLLNIDIIEEEEEDIDESEEEPAYRHEEAEEKE